MDGLMDASGDLVVQDLEGLEGGLLDWGNWWAAMGQGPGARAPERRAASGRMSSTFMGRLRNPQPPGPPRGPPGRSHPADWRAPRRGGCDRLTSAVVGPRAMLAARDVLVLACDAPAH